MKLNNFGFGAGSGGSSDAITGSGTTNKVAKFTDANIIGNSQITDDGTTVFIGSSATSAKAAFEINSTTQGVLFPRLNTTQINAIAIGAATNSLLVYSTSAKRFRYYEHVGGGWETIATLNDIPASPTTLYSGDSSLSSSRTVTMGANSLLFAGNLTTFRGIGATSATSSLLVQDSGSNDLFRVRNDGAVMSTNGYWQGTTKILYINPNGTIGNLFVGENSGTSITTGDYNVGVGSSALASNTTGVSNMANGFFCLNKNTTGNYNIAIGQQTLTTNISGSNNIGIGYLALRFNLANSNTAIGHRTLEKNTSGTENVAIGLSNGLSALSENTTGVSNIAIGGSLYNNTTGSYNIGMGQYSLGTTTTSSNNVAIGYFSLTYATTGSQTAIGVSSLGKTTTGLQNTAIGFSSSKENTTGSYNTSVGNSALLSNQLGSSSVALGYQAGYHETGSNKLFIDNTSRANEADGRVKALIYGVFAATVANQRLNINASLGIGGGVANATSVLNIANLPTSSVGLVTGDVWSNGGVLTIV